MSSYEVIKLIERFVLWLGVGSLLLVALRTMVHLVTLCRELLITYKTILEIKEFLAKATERERRVIEPVQEDIDRIIDRHSREVQERTGKRPKYYQLPDRAKQEINEQLLVLLELKEGATGTRWDINHTVVECLEKLNRGLKPRLVGPRIENWTLLLAAFVFFAVYLYTSSM
jgi:hypothetical protein